MDRVLHFKGASELFEDAWMSRVSFEEQFSNGGPGDRRDIQCSELQWGDGEAFRRSEWNRLCERKVDPMAAPRSRPPWADISTRRLLRY